MQNIKVLYLIILFSIVSLIDIYAQENNSYELLWQIESKEQSVPSYLFGTMHVKDSRAFNFSDSVMTSIEKCEVFALEVEPDSIVEAVFGAMLETDTTDYLKELLSTDEYQQFKVRFKERTGYEYDNLESKNPMILDIMLQPDFSKPTDKQSFVDAYLYGIAKTMNKKTVGLEDIRTQIDMFSLASEKQQREMVNELLQYNTKNYEVIYDKMADIYSTGDIGLMEEFMKEDATDSLLVVRNHVMANSMERLMREHTTFAAVGTAHLWGEEGVIELLRKKGYTVSLVPATFTGVADRYTIDVSKMKWTTYRDEALGFTIEMPGKPFPFDMEDEAGMKIRMLMYPDIATETNFVVMTVDFRELPMGGVSDEQLMDLMIQGMKDTELADFKKKKMKKADREGLELFLKEASGRASTMEMFVKNKILYAIFFEGKRQDLKQPYIKRFFNSYKSTTPTPLAEKTSDDWSVYRNNAGAFSVTMPSTPEYNTIEEEDEDSIEPFVKHIFMSTDPQKMIGYVVVYNDYPVQYFLSRRKNAFTLLFKEYETGSSKIKILSEPEPVFTDGVEGRKCYVTNNGNYGELRLYIRGNRIYRMMKQNLATDKQELPDDIFFDSLKFVEHLPPEFEDFISEGGKITLKRFDRFYTEIDTLTDHESFVYNDFSLYTTNPHTGGSYIFGSAKIKDNYRIEHLDTFYNWRIDKYKSYRDSIISMVPVEIEGKAGREVFQAHKRTGNLMRYRFWIDNDELFFMSAHSDEKELFSETTDAFFNSFRRTGNNPPFDIYASKTKNILDGLKSEDTLVYQQNVGAMEYYQFIEEDLPLLYEAMYRNYPDDTLYYNGAKSKIIDNITYLNDASSIGELKKLYLQVNDIQKNKILRSLMDFSDEDKGRDAVIQLLLKKPPERLRSDALIFSCFEDSLALGAQYLPQLLNLLEKKDYRNDIIRLAVKLVRSDTMPYVNLVENSFEMLTKYALNDLEESKIIYASTGNVRRPYSPPAPRDYFVLMTHVKGKKITDEYTNIFLNAKMTRADHLKVEAVSVRLLNGLKTDEKLIEPLMTSLKTRYGMIKAYQKVGQLHKVPKNYRTPEAIAQVKLRVNIPLSRKLDDTKILGTIPWGSSKLYVIKFTCKYDDEMKDYVGLVGPFSASGEWEFDTLKAYPSWDEEAIKNWRKAAKDMLEDFEEKGK